jgi:uncharacterized membrane protein
MDTATVALALVLGLALSLSTGLRAFLAPFFLSVASWAGWVHPSAALAWMASPLAVVAFGSAIVFETAADKIPAVDHVMDSLHLFLKPVAGALVAMAMMQGVDPVVGAVAGICTGGVVAGTMHVAKATVRVGSTATTVGMGNPVLSILEDVFAVGLAACAAIGAGAITT